MHPVLRRTALMTVLGCMPVVAQPVASQPVTSQMLLDGLKDPAKWLMFGGDYTSQRHSPLEQLTPQNVDRLTPQWLFQSQTPASLDQGTQLEIDSPECIRFLRELVSDYAQALTAKLLRKWHCSRRRCVGDGGIHCA